MSEITSTVTLVALYNCFNVSMSHCRICSNCHKSQMLSWWLSTIVKLSQNTIVTLVAVHQYHSCSASVIRWSVVSPELTKNKPIAREKPVFEKNPKLCIFLRSGWSPLLLAASNGHIDLVKIFLDVNARVDVFDQEARWDL